MRFFISGLIFLSAQALLAYQPIRYSPLDVYVLNPNGKGPRSLQIYNSRGVKTKTAHMQYDARGRLLKEIFFDSKGKKEGESRFVYTDAGPVKEELYNASGKLLTIKVFTYQGKQIKEMRVLDTEGRLELRQTFRYKHARLIAGQESNGTGMLKFSVSYANQRPTRIEIRNDTNRVLSSIQYSYDSKGILLERTRKQSGSTHKFIYTYSAGKVAYYELLELTRDGWRKIRKIQYIY